MLVHYVIGFEEFENYAAELLQEPLSKIIKKIPVGNVLFASVFIVVGIHVQPYYELQSY